MNKKELYTILANRLHLNCHRNDDKCNFRYFLKKGICVLRRLIGGIKNFFWSFVSFQFLPILFTSLKALPVYIQSDSNIPMLIVACVTPIH